MPESPSANRPRTPGDAGSRQEASSGTEEDRLIDGFRELGVASVADAIDRVAGEPGYMTHAIHPVSKGRIAGRAVTVLERPSLREAGPPIHALEAMDAADPGSVLVIGIDGAADAREVAFWGGLMTAGAVAGGLTGVVLDGATRDVDEAKEAEFPIYARAVVPSTTVGRYLTVDRDVAVTCGGVRTAPGDVIVGDADGVAVVPGALAEDVLEAALEIEATEREMTEAIRESGSILAAFRRFGRI